MYHSCMSAMAAKKYEETSEEQPYRAYIYVMYLCNENQGSPLHLPVFMLNMEIDANSRQSSVMALCGVCEGNPCKLRNLMAQLYWKNASRCCSPWTNPTDGLPRSALTDGNLIDLVPYASHLVDAVYELPPFYCTLLNADIYHNATFPELYYILHFRNSLTSPPPKHMIQIKILYKESTGNFASFYLFIGFQRVLFHLAYMRDHV